MAEVHEMAHASVKGMVGVPDYRSPQIGATYNWNDFDGLGGQIVHDVANEWITNQIEKDGLRSDFLGLQYYFRQTAPFLQLKHKDRDYGDHPAFGDMYPPGILEALRKMNAAYPNKDIFITEMGFADKADQRKPYLLLETMRYVLQAKKEGIPVKGVLLWSLVNNLEWDLGMDTNFGLFSEKELDSPLPQNTEGVKSFQAWQATIQVLTKPSPESLNHLQAVYDKAKAQYDMAKKSK